MQLYDEVLQGATLTISSFNTHTSRSGIYTGAGELERIGEDEALQGRAAAAAVHRSPGGTVTAPHGVHSHESSEDFDSAFNVSEDSKQLSLSDESVIVEVEHLGDFWVPKDVQEALAASVKSAAGEVELEIPSLESQPEALQVTDNSVGPTAAPSPVHSYPSRAATASVPGAAPQFSFEYAPMPMVGSEISSTTRSYLVVRFLAQGAHGACFVVKDTDTHVLHCAKVRPSEVPALSILPNPNQTRGFYEADADAHAVNISTFAFK